MDNQHEASVGHRVGCMGTEGTRRRGPLFSLGAAVALMAGLCGSVYGQEGPDMQRGRALYENHCQACHETWVHQRMRHVHSLQALEQRVRSWQIHAGLAWTADDIADVTAYLNETFYHLPPPPTPNRR